MEDFPYIGCFPTWVLTLESRHLECERNETEKNFIKMEPRNPREQPPISTAMGEIVGWRLERTSGFPESQRIPFGQRLDNLSLDALGFAVKGSVGGYSK